MNENDQDKMPSADIWPKILEVADSYASAISLAFLAGIANYKKGINKRLLLEALENKKMKDVMEIFNINEKDFIKINKVAKKLIDKTAKTIVSEYGLNINIKDMALHKYIDEYVADLVVQVGEKTKLAIKDRIRDGWDKEILPKTLAKNITEEIGLDQRRMHSLMRYEHSLIKDEELAAKYPKTEAGNKAYWEKIHELKMKKYNTLLFDRAMTITRTECINLANEGSRATYEEMAKRNPIIKEEYELEWIITPDDRLCNHCRTMKNQRCSFTGSFTFVKTDKEGRELSRSNFRRPTLHPRCRCCIVCVRKK